MAAEYEDYTEASRYYDEGIGLYFERSCVIFGRVTLHRPSSYRNRSDRWSDLCWD